VCLNFGEVRIKLSLSQEKYIFWTPDLTSRAIDAAIKNQVPAKQENAWDGNPARVYE
jgi:hypothetical protein